MARVEAKVTARADLKDWEAMRRAIMRTEQRVKVGILEDSSHNASEEEEGEDDNESASEISMLELGAIHEFGAPAANIPERSFLRSTLNSGTDQIREAVRTIVASEISKLFDDTGHTLNESESIAKRALGKMGAKVVAMIRQTIRARETEGPEDQELKPATIRRKGSDLPLVDTGQLINAITWAVVAGKDDE